MFVNITMMFVNITMMFVDTMVVSIDMAAGLLCVHCCMLGY
jgi:hypothetical protein